MFNGIPGSYTPPELKTEERELERQYKLELLRLLADNPYLKPLIYKEFNCEEEKEVSNQIELDFKEPNRRQDDLFETCISYCNQLTDCNTDLLKTLKPLNEINSPVYDLYFKYILELQNLNKMMMNEVTKIIKEVESER